MLGGEATTPAVRYPPMMTTPPLLPKDLREFVGRDWSRLDALDRERRAGLPVAEKSRLAVALYEAAKRTRPGWPTAEDRWEDLQEHIRVNSLLKRGANVGAR